MLSHNETYKHDEIHLICTQPIIQTRVKATIKNDKNVPKSNRSNAGFHYFQENFATFLYMYYFLNCDKLSHMGIYSTKTMIIYL